MALRYPRVLLIDNADSFTYNLVDYLRQLGCAVQVVRNTIEPEQIEQFAFDLMVISPGPSVPRNAGNLMAILQRYSERTPILGICLGLQALVEHFGGSISRVAPRHGKSDPCTHDGLTLFSGLPPVLHVGRYHSWAARDLPAVLEVSARAQDGVIMGVRHKTLPIEAVQFHPESILTTEGNAGFELLRNAVSGALYNGYADYRRLLTQLQSPSTLSADAHVSTIDLLAADSLTEDQRLVLLVALAFRLQQPEPLAGFVRAVLDRSTLADTVSPDPTAIDLCGTGGSGLPRLNTSTLTALLLSGLGLPIAKHGNRAASGRTGSFDLLEALGVPPSTPIQQAVAALAETKLSFLFAPSAHPVMGKLAGARARVGIPTLFNVLGPLLNPFQPKRQLIGTAFAEYQQLLLEAGILLGREQLFVVRAEDGLDEISVSVPTHVLAYQHGTRSEVTLTPRSFGIDPIPFAEVAVASPKEAYHRAEVLLTGLGSTPHYALVAANAAFIYAQFVEAIPLDVAYQKMVGAIADGTIGRQLSAYKRSLGLIPALERSAA